MAGAGSLVEMSRLLHVDSRAIERTHRPGLIVQTRIYLWRGDVAGVVLPLYSIKAE